MNNQVNLIDTHRSLRDAFGRFATGITVVGVEVDNHFCGMTVNSFSSVSLEPPLVSWCIAEQSSLFEVFTPGKHFSINVLGQGQQELSKLFSSEDDACKKNEKWLKGDNNTPLLKDSLATFQCQLENRYPGGDHAILVSRVLHYTCGTEEPLVFFGGQYRQLTP